MTAVVNTQNTLLLKNLLNFYKENNNLQKMLNIINGEAAISLRIVDWFTTNYAKKNYTVFDLPNGNRFKVYIDYKLKLRSYSKRRFDPFCRWERINVPYMDQPGTFVQTTIGQLNFFKWAFENQVIAYIENNYSAIERDMNSRNSTSKRKYAATTPENISQKTRKKREELSISASKTIKQEIVEIVIKFN
jgi:hypothetical protein